MTALDTRLHDWVAPDGTTALIFDCDGTLADTMPAHYVAWRETLAAHGIEFSEDRFYGLAGVPTPRIVRIVADEHGVALDEAAVAAIAAAKEDRFMGSGDGIVPIAAVAAIAERYRGNLPIAVASGGEHRVVRHTLTAIGALQWFDAIVAAEDTERHKPEPDVFLEAANRLGVPATGCVVFEDSDLGIEAAHRAGMTAVDVRPIAAAGA